jgi:hypothetical protein
MSNVSNVRQGRFGDLQDSALGTQKKSVLTVGALRVAEKEIYIALRYFQKEAFSARLAPAKECDALTKFGPRKRVRS